MKSILYFILLCSFCSCMFINSTQRKHYRNASKIKPIDVVIIPGLPLYKGKLDTLLKSRILWSEFLYNKGVVSTILYSGNAVYTPWGEGESMAILGKQLGIKPEHILIDTTAEHSTENLYYGYQMAKQMGFKTIAVATDPFQCIMLKKYARKHFKEKIHFIPIIYDSIKNKMNIPLEMDTTLTKKKNFIPINQRQNYRERLKGTRGKHIQY